LMKSRVQSRGSVHLAALGLVSMVLLLVLSWYYATVSTVVLEGLIWMHKTDFSAETCSACA